jgi:hypothetical protein
MSATTERKSYTLTVPNWQPARLNQFVGRHWSSGHRLKKSDRILLAGYAMAAAIPPASGKRRVSLEITLSPRQRAGDPDAYWKSVLDGLVAARLLIDDNRQHVELGTVAFRRGDGRQTTIILEDEPSGELPNAGLCAVCGLDVRLSDPPRTPEGKPLHVGCDTTAMARADKR